MHSGNVQHTKYAPGWNCTKLGWGHQMMCGAKTRLDSEGFDVYPDRVDAIGWSDRHGLSDACILMSLSDLPSRGNFVRRSLHKQRRRRVSQAVVINKWGVFGILSVQEDPGSSMRAHLVSPSPSSVSVHSELTISTLRFGGHNWPNNGQLHVGPGFSLQERHGRHETVCHWGGRSPLHRSLERRPEARRTNVSTRRQKALEWWVLPAWLGLTRTAPCPR